MRIYLYKKNTIYYDIFIVRNIAKYFDFYLKLNHLMNSNFNKYSFE